MGNRTSVVILNWNTRHYLEQFLPSVIKYSHEVADIIVADNASTDDSVSFLEKNFPQIRIIKIESNMGYTGGYNAALEKVDSEYFVLLNSDVLVTENWLSPLIKLMDSNPGIGACQPKILSFHNPEYFEYAGAAGGFIDKFGYPFCRGRIFNTLEKDEKQYDDDREVFWATGACMFVRASAFRILKGFDENFFAHMEEIDLCWRMQHEGHKIYYCGKSSVLHVGGGTLHKSNPRKTYLNFRNNLLMIYKNADEKSLSSILSFRLILDGIAAVKFLLSGGYPDFKAVWNAHKDFNQLKSQYPRGFREINSSRHSPKFLIFPYSILWYYYICSRKKFSTLNWKISGKYNS